MLVRHIIVLIVQIVLKKSYRSFLWLIKMAFGTKLTCKHKEVLAINFLICAHFNDQIQSEDNNFQSIIVNIRV